MESVIDRLRIPPGLRPDLSAFDTRESFGWDKDQAKDRLVGVTEKLDRLHARLYAEGARGVIVVLQGLDAAGKDGTTRGVFGPLNATGLVVHAFKRPTERELAHDYLWRAHKACPARGSIAIWNRSHYEDVLVVRVAGLAPERVWSRRYEHINAFEKLLSDEGFAVVKCMLHVSADEQAERLAERLKVPEKAWKFDAGDFDTRRRRSAYIRAYEDAIERTGTDHAPWHVIPADRNWVRNLCVGQIVLETLERLDPKLPELKLSATEIAGFLAQVE